MDFGEEDLFAVFDSESSKGSKSGVASRLLQAEDNEAAASENTESAAATKPIKFDTGSLVAEICGTNNKRWSQDAAAAEVEVKKIKTDANDVTLMTGLSDREVERTLKGESADWETQESRESRTLEDDDKAAISLVESAPRIKIHTLETPSSCTHEVAVPPSCPFQGLVDPAREPAKTYPFTLDSFQSQSILCIENDQSVLVSAHTSAGKTVVAEYAIALSLKNKQRVIYTTPIKALSNQKYREFFEEFSDVGLMTGDVTINPSASCLIMTTEILRSMLYRGSEIMREVGWVIFDEIHYMRDKERGVVWEETIILLPDNVHYVFLSATIPNARQFAEWIAHLHHQPCHVVYTDFRPTPLQHYIFPAGGDGIHLVVDEHGQFREDNFSTAMAVLQNAGDAAKGDQRGRKGGMKDGSNIFKIVKMIMERNFAPVIVFSFSKKECEAYALQMAKLDFNTNEEKKLVDEVFNNAMMVLSKEDRTLPQVENVLPLLKRGIGIHHGGLLPILKETIEILFGEGLLKALFATETFAMGLNMPARTVLFTSVQKFDGKDFRWLSSGEYIQMSGRAGRRGLDDKGIVILMVDEKMSPSVGRDIVKGAPDAINSAFHLTYNMVLNLLRVEEVNPEYMMERSFRQFQNYSTIPQVYQNVKELEERLGGLRVENEVEVESYSRLWDQLASLSQQFHAFLTRPQYIVPFLQPGRLVKVRNLDQDFGWASVVNLKRTKAEATPEGGGMPEESFVADVLLHVTKDTAKSRVASELCAVPAGQTGEMVVIPILLPLIQQISTVRLFIPQDLRPLDNRMAVLKAIREALKRFPNPPLLDPVTDMKIGDSEFKEIIKKITTFEKRLEKHPLHGSPGLPALLEAYKAKARVLADYVAAKMQLKRSKSLLQMEELKCMKRVLRRLGYCTAADVIEIKGRIACELSSADELLLTEMMFNGLFNPLNPPQVAAILSCFVCSEKSNDMPKLTDMLSGPLRAMQDMARKIARVSKEAKLEMEEDEYVEKFKPFMMDIVYEWTKGCSFLEICKMTDMFEGSIIRSMRLLEELMRQMVQASKNIGNTELENKFAEAIKLLKRDIVFAASLYL